MLLSSMAENNLSVTNIPQKNSIESPQDSLTSFTDLVLLTNNDFYCIFFLS